MWRVRINSTNRKGSFITHLATREAVDLYLDEPWGTGSTAHFVCEMDVGWAPEQWPRRTRAVYVESPTGEREELNTPAPVEEIHGE